jgi:predicted Holliday junction resolvase-like endonuclease
MNALTSERSTHMNIASRFQLFSIITKCVYIHFQIQRLENKLASVEKELQQVKKDSVALTRYINARRKKEEETQKEGRGGGLEEGDSGGTDVQ